MSRRLHNAMLIHSAAQDARMGQPRWGVVTSYNPNDSTAKVMLQPEGVLTDWLPVVSLMVGGGWGLIAPPLPGQQVVCIPDGGDHENYVIMGGTWSTAALPPTPANAIGTGGTLSTGQVQVQPGEAALVSKAGAVLRLAADGSIYLRGTVNIDGNLNVNGNVVAQENVAALQNIYDLNGAHSSVAALRSDYNAHTHQVPNVQAGASTVTTATTSAPDN